MSQHALIRTALGHLLAERPAFRVVGEAGTRAEALLQAAHLAPDIVLLDLHRDGDLWLETIAPLVAAARPRGRVLLLSSVTAHTVHREALRQGARGILDLDHPAETLFRAIERVHAGEVWMERRLMAELLAPDAGADDHAAPLEPLTRREHEILQLIAEGLKNKEIARRLSVTDVTVRHHLTSIFAKLDVADRLSLVVFAFRHGLARPTPPRHERSGCALDPHAHESPSSAGS